MPKRGQQHPEETGKVEWWESIRWQSITLSNEGVKFLTAKGISINRGDFRIPALYI